MLDKSIPSLKWIPRTKSSYFSKHIANSKLSCTYTKLFSITSYPQCIFWYTSIENCLGNRSYCISKFSSFKSSCWSTNNKSSNCSYSCSNVRSCFFQNLNNRFNYFFKYLCNFFK